MIFQNKMILTIFLLQTVSIMHASMMAQNSKTSSRFPKNQTQSFQDPSRIFSLLDMDNARKEEQETAVINLKLTVDKTRAEEQQAAAKTIQRYQIITTITAITAAVAILNQFIPRVAFAPWLQSVGRLVEQIRPSN